MHVVIINWRQIVQIILTLASIGSSLQDYKWSETSKGRLSDQHEALAPEFDDLSLREIQAKSGQTVLFPCTVRNLGDKVVSWIRTKDLHIITSGSHTFSADNRFESVNSARTDFWGMRIRGVRISDSGQYECQVNTDPKMNLAINLSVTDLRTKTDHHPTYKWVNEAKIKGPIEVYIRKSSPIVLTCEISTTSKSNIIRTQIYWLHDGKQISLDSSRGGISVETDYRDFNSVSRLRVAEVSSQDSGVYTCTQASAKPASMKLFVVEAEHTEAMQRDAPQSWSTSLHKYNWLNIIILIIGYFIL